MNDPPRLRFCLTHCERPKEGTLQRTRDRRPLRTTLSHFYSTTPCRSHYTFLPRKTWHAVGPRSSHTAAFKCNPSIDARLDEEILESPLPSCTIDTALEISRANCRMSATQATRPWSPTFPASEDTALQHPH